MFINTILVRKILVFILVFGLMFPENGFSMKHSPSSHTLAPYSIFDSPEDERLIKHAIFRVFCSLFEGGQTQILGDPITTTIEDKEVILGFNSPIKTLELKGLLVPCSIGNRMYLAYLERKKVTSRKNEFPLDVHVYNGKDMYNYLEIKQKTSKINSELKTILDNNIYEHRGKVRLSLWGYTLHNVISFFKQIDKTISDATNQEKSEESEDTIVKQIIPFVKDRGIFKVINVPEFKMDYSSNDFILVKDRNDPTRLEIAVIFQILTKMGIPQIILEDETVKKTITTEYLNFKKNNSVFYPNKIISVIGAKSNWKIDLLNPDKRKFADLDFTRNRNFDSPDFTKENEPEQVDSLEQILNFAETVPRQHTVKPGRLFPNLIRFLGIYGPPGKETDVIDELRSFLYNIGAENIETELLHEGDLEGPMAFTRDSLVQDAQEASVTGISPSQNLLATIPATDSSMPTILLCAHADSWGGQATYFGFDETTKKLINRSEKFPLGIDNRDGVAAILETLQILKDENIPHGKIKLLFTAHEELGRLGIHANSEDFLRDVDIALTFDSPFRPKRPTENFIQSHTHPHDVILREIKKAAVNLNLTHEVLYIDEHSGDSDVISKFVGCTFDFANGSSGIHNAYENTSIAYYLKQIDWLVESIKNIGKIKKHKACLAEMSDVRNLAKMAISMERAFHPKNFSFNDIDREEERESELIKYFRILTKNKQLIVVKDGEGNIVTFADFWLLDQAGKYQIKEIAERFLKYDSSNKTKHTKGICAFSPRSLQHLYEIRDIEKFSIFYNDIMDVLKLHHPQVKEFLSFHNKIWHEQKLDNSDQAVENLSLQIHLKNQELKPIQTDKKEIICHILTEGVVPTEQSTFISELEIETRDSKSREKILFLPFSTTQNKLKSIEEKIVATQEFYKEKGYSVKFNIAVSQMKLLREIHKDLAHLGIKGIAIKPNKGNFVQVESILMALRARQTDNLKLMRKVYEYITGRSSKVEGNNILDIEHFVHNFIFILPGIELENPKQHNDNLKEFIKHA